MKEGFEGGRGLVVETLETRLEASCDQCVVGTLVGLEDGGSCLGLHGFCMDVVGIVAVQDKELCVALAGGEDEAAGLVSEDLAG